MPSPIALPNRKLFHRAFLPARTCAGLVLMGVVAAVVPGSLAGEVPQDEAPPAPRAPASGPAYVAPSPAKSVEIGNFYLKRKSYKAALSRFREAAQTNPEYAPAYLGLGKTYEKLGRRQEALDAYEKYLDLLPSDKDAEQAKEVQRALRRLGKTPAPTG